MWFEVKICHDWSFLCFVFLVGLLWMFWFGNLFDLHHNKFRRLDLRVRLFQFLSVSQVLCKLGGLKSQRYGAAYGNYQVEKV